jgi:phage head maturation protease
MAEIKQIHLKDASISEAGMVKAVFATLNVIDHDGDIITNGSIPNGHPVRMSAYNHASWGNALPVGKGTISEVGDQLIFDGQFFLDTADGADTYKTVKNLGGLVEWSFGFDIIEQDSAKDEESGKEIRLLKRLNVTEVSPVLLGAGIGTRTIDVKSAEPPHGAKSKQYKEHAELVFETCADFVKRSQSIADLRIEEGKEAASEKNRECLKAIAAELFKAAGELKRIAETDTEAQEAEAKQKAAELVARFEYLNRSA